MTARLVAKVFLVGAGPGDPELLTLKGKRCLEQADVVLYDDLVNDELLAHAPQDAARIYVGKRAASCPARRRAQVVCPDGAALPNRNTTLPEPDRWAP